MTDMTFNTDAGKTIDRELMIAYLNTGTSSSPTWSALGTRVSDSDASYDWSKDTSTDILGSVRTTMKKPTITQSFDPCNLDSGDTAITKLWNLAVKEQDIASLAAQDMLIVHLYAGTKNTASFAERYSACAIEVSSIGGEGGGSIEMPIDVTYGGTRTTGTASVADGVVTFTADSSN